MAAATFTAKNGTQLPGKRKLQGKKNRYLFLFIYIVNSSRRNIEHHFNSSLVHVNKHPKSF